MAEPSAADIDRLVVERFPDLHACAMAMLVAPNLFQGKNAAPDIAEKLARLEAARAEFLAMPRENLLALIEASREREQAAERKRSEIRQAAGDAQRFYNQPKAVADFGYWCKLPYWTLDEAVALLLGLDPHVVNPEALERELAQKTGLLNMGKPPERRPFHQTYARLRTLIERDEALNVDRLQPAELVAWAMRSKSVRLPDKLVQIVNANDVAPSAEISRVSDGPSSPTSMRRAGTPKAWDAAKLEELKQHRAAHGTKASAKHFGISEARVRQLLPGRTQKPSTASAPFGSLVHRSK